MRNILIQTPPKINRKREMKGEIFESPPSK